MTDISKTVEVVRDVVEKQLAPATVLDVNIEEDFDHMGDPILRITVTFEVEGDKLIPEKVISLARHLREPLERIKEDRFPVFTFLKPGEMDGAAA